MPASPDAERTILGAVMLDNTAVNEAAEVLHADDFYVESHRRIFARMLDLSERGAAIDMITLAEELRRRKELESVGGVAYVSSLIDGVPHQPSIESYVRIVRDKAMLRSLVHASSAAIERALDNSEAAAEVLEAMESAVFNISERRIGNGFLSIPSIVKESFGSIDALFQRGQ